LALYKPEIKCCKPAGSSSTSIERLQVTSQVWRLTETCGKNVWHCGMTRSCSAFGCTNRDTKDNRDKGLTFYRIPVKKEKRRLWLSAINRKDFDPPADACICSEHFVGGM